MPYQALYQSPLGTLRLTANENALTELEFAEDAGGKNKENKENGAACPVIQQAQRWLDLYFAGKEPDFKLPLELQGSDFQMAVWQILQRIPYGQLVTYGEIAREIAAQRRLPHMSAQAVGGAVGRNPIAIIVPCHRVIGVGGRLTGYASGLPKKIALLRLEGVDMSRLK